MRARWPALLAVVALCGSACSGDPKPAAPANADVRICLYTDGNSGTFWTTLKGGAEQAAHDLGVTLDYQEADHDLEAEGHLAEDGVRSGCDAMGISAPEAAGLQHAADAVYAAGIPLLAVNSGEAVYEQLHAFTYVGQDDALAGRQAGSRLAGAGATRLLCVMQDGEDPTVDQLCAGASDTVGSVVPLRLTRGLADLPASAAEIEAQLGADPGIDAVLSVDPDLAVGAVLPALEAVGSPLPVGALGVSEQAVRAVAAGTLAFAIDEQPYAEGYLSVVLLNLAATTGAEAGGGRPVLTGPAFVTKDNADRLLELETAGTR